MKRKRIFSTLLLGALVIASTSMVTSCKDYDDDINTVNSRVDDLNTSLTKQITALQADLKTAQQTASDAAAAAATAANAAKAAQATGDAAAAAAAAAQLTANTANAAAATAQAKADQNAIDLAKATLAIAGKADQSALNDSVAKLSGMIAAIDTRLLIVQDSVATFSNRISANAAALYDLQGQVATLNAFKTLIEQQAPEVLALINSNIAKVNERVDSVNNVLDKAKEDIAKNASDIITINGKLATDEGIINKNSIDIVKNATAIATNAGNIQTNTADIETLKGKMDKANQAITDLDNALTNKINTLQAQVNDGFATVTLAINTLNTYVDKTITSLVFAPTEWNLSFPAIPVYRFDGCHDITINSGAISVDGETYTTAAADKVYAITPEAVANYHLNPSSADISNYKFSFIDLETTNKYSTRGHQDAESVDPVVTKTAVNNGILSVNFKFNSENVNDAVIDLENGKAWVSTVALQATHKNLEGNDASVTSDYAILSPTFANTLDLGNNEYKADQTGERSVKNYLVDKTSKVALNSYRNSSDSVSFKLGYNDATGINLNNKVEVVYTEGSKQRQMSVDAAKKLGFDVAYTLVSYKINKNSTVDETAASKVQLTDGVAKVANQDKSGIGHAALVRVELKYANKTVVVGYITVLVTPTGLYQVDETYADGLKVVCGGSQAYTVLSSAIKQDIVAATTITTDQYDASYSFEAGKRYTEATVAADKVDADPFGTVALNSKQDTLKWTFTEAQLAKKFYDKYGNYIAPTADIVTYVRYVSNDVNKYPNVFVKLIIPKSAISHAAGSIDIATAGIKQYWYADRSMTAGSGYDEVHANVPQPGNASVTNDSKFELNLLSVFNGNDINVALDGNKTFQNLDKGANIYFNVAKYDAEQTTTKWNSASGTQYKLTATPAQVTATPLNADGTEAGAGAVVVKLEGSTVKLQSNDYAKDLLNVAPHKNADGTTDAFKTYMIIKADNNCYPIDLSGSTTTFNVRYLRPVDVTSANNASFEDGTANGYSELNIAELFNYNDWRDMSFGQDNTDWLWFYGITKLTPHIDEAQCDLNGDWQLLSAVTSLIKLTAKTSSQGLPLIKNWNWYVSNMGTVRYQNNGATVGDFNLKIPFTVVHNWGNIENVVVEIPVKKTPTAKKN